MALRPEIESALIVVVGTWAAKLADIEPKYRKAALARWLKRYESIYGILEKRFENQ